MRKRIFIALLGNLLGVVALALLLAWAVGAQGPSWKQVNIDGFGNSSNEGVISLAVFSDTLYAGTYNGNGGEIWRMDSPWTAVITSGLGYTHNRGIDHLIEFNNYLYAGTLNVADGGEVWRYDGLGWTQGGSGGLKRRG